MSDVAEGLLSVIVPVYNVLPYLEACVSSVLAQDYADTELILVDDGSTDGSGALADELAKADARITVLHQTNGGLSAARNAGLERARGAWIGFLDSDDWVSADMYSRLIALCEQHGAEIGVCAFRYVYPDGHAVPGGDTGDVRIYARQEALERLPLETDVRFEACPKVFRRDVIGDARFLPRQVFEDIRFTRLTFQRMTRCVYVDLPLYQYRQKRAGNTSSAYRPEKLGTAAECDLFVQELRKEGLTLAADRMEAFTLDFLIRLYVNARTNGADRAALRDVLSAYRTRFAAAKKNPCVRRARGALFCASPALYDEISKRLHRRA